jgi:hypothetical protein
MSRLSRIAKGNSHAHPMPPLHVRFALGQLPPLLVLDHVRCERGGTFYRRLHGRACFIDLFLRSQQATQMPGTANFWNRWGDMIASLLK